MNAAALAALSSQYGALPNPAALAPFMNPATMAAMAHMQNDSVQSFMNNIIGNLIKQNQSAGNCYNIE